MINGNTTVNYSIYPCADGKFLAIAALEIKFWNNICDTLNKPDWKREGEFELLLSNFPKKEVEALLTRTVAAKTTQDLAPMDFSLAEEDPLLKKFRDAGIE